MSSIARLIVCHQSRLFRECLIAALTRVGFTEINVLDGPHLAAIPPARPEGLDLLLVDACLPEMAAFQLVQAVRTTEPAWRTILLASAAAPSLIAHCLRADADGCVLDEDTFDDLHQAIETVLRGGSYRSPQIQMARRLLERSDEQAQPNRWSDRPRNCRLTRRQLEVLEMAYRDLSNKQIARELHLSIFTVKNHFQSIYQKWKVEDRQSALRLAVQLGLLGDPLALGKPRLADLPSVLHQAAQLGLLGDPIT